MCILGRGGVLKLIAKITMVIINYKAGQLGNRLFYFAHFISNSIEYEYKLINPYFNEYCKFFESTANDSFGDHRISVRFTQSKILDRLIRLNIKLFSLIVYVIRRGKKTYYFHNIYEYDKKGVDFNLIEIDYLNNAKNKIVFVEGWRYRDPEHFKKHSQLLKTFFTPKKEYLNKIDNVIEECRKKGDLIIGIHIRRGDYRYYNQGKWCYQDNTYFEKMNQFNDIMKNKGKKCVFLICSNEIVYAGNFKGLNVVIDNRHLIVDLYSLAKCDYIIGPPSTFTMWASFYGNVPLLMLNSADQQILLSQFKIQG